VRYDTHIGSLPLPSGPIRDESDLKTHLIIVICLTQQLNKYIPTKGTEFSIFYLKKGGK